MATALKKRFIILTGGPGLFKGCDKEHDQTWTNYIVPLQLAAERGLYKRMDTNRSTGSSTSRPTATGGRTIR